MARQEYPRSLSLKALTAHFERSWVSHTQMKASLMDVMALAVGALSATRAQGC